MKKTKKEAARLVMEKTGIAALYTNKAKRCSLYLHES